MIRKTVIATHRVEGFHFWPGAPPHRGYLGLVHRHLFHIRLEVGVTDSDRELEFHDLVDWIDSLWGNERPVKFNGQSCESIAEHIITEWQNAEPGFDQMPVSVEVWEDGENGARVEFTPPLPMTLDSFTVEVPAELLDSTHDAPISTGDSDVRHS